MVSSNFFSAISVVALVTVASCSSLCNNTAVFPNVGPTNSFNLGRLYPKISLDVTGIASGLVNIVGIGAGSSARIDISYSAASAQLLSQVSVTNSSSAGNYYFSDPYFDATVKTPTSQFSSSDCVNVLINIFIPAGNTSVSVSTVNADIQIQSTLGFQSMRLSLETNTGNIIASQGNIQVSTLSATSVNGTVSFSSPTPINASTSVDLKSQHANIYADNINAPSISLTTSEGKIVSKYLSPFRDFSSRSTSGNIECVINMGLASTPSIYAYSSMGNVALLVGPTVAWNIQADTKKGLISITASDPARLNVTAVPSYYGNRTTGTYGSGPGKLTASANGDVNIAFGDVVPGQVSPDALTFVGPPIAALISGASKASVIGLGVVAVSLCLSVLL